MTVLTDIQLSVYLTVPGGILELNDHVGYYVADGAFEDEQVTFRRSEAKSPFIDGTYIYNARKENIVENLAVYVTGATTYQKDQLLLALKNALSQPHFQMHRVLEGSHTIWTCYASDYVITSQRALLHSHMALLKAQVICDPGVVNRSESTYRATRVALVSRIPRPELQFSSAIAPASITAVTAMGTPAAANPSVATTITAVAAMTAPVTRASVQLNPAVSINAVAKVKDGVGTNAATITAVATVQPPAGGGGVVIVAIPLVMRVVVNTVMVNRQATLAPNSITAPGVAVPSPTVSTP